MIVQEWKKKFASISCLQTSYARSRPLKNISVCSPNSVFLYFCTTSYARRRPVILVFLLHEFVCLLHFRLFGMSERICCSFLRRWKKHSELKDHFSLCGLQWHKMYQEDLWEVGVSEAAWSNCWINSTIWFVWGSSNSPISNAPNTWHGFCSSASTVARQICATASPDEMASSFASERQLTMCNSSSYGIFWVYRSANDRANETHDVLSQMYDRWIVWLDCTETSRIMDAIFEVCPIEAARAKRHLTNDAYQEKKSYTESMHFGKLFVNSWFAFFPPADDYV